MTINLHKELEAWLVVAEGMAKAGIIVGTNTTASAEELAGQQSWGFYHQHCGLAAVRGIQYPIGASRSGAGVPAWLNGRASDL